MRTDFDKTLPSRIVNAANLGMWRLMQLEYGDGIDGVKIDGIKAKEANVKSSFELACFLFHLAIRDALVSGGPPQADKVRAILEQAVIKQFLDKNYNGNSASMRRTARKLSERLAEAQFEFAPLSMSLTNVSDPVCAHSLIPQAARNMMEALGHEVPQTTGRPENWAYADYEAVNAVKCRFKRWRTRPLNPIVFVGLIQFIAALLPRVFPKHGHQEEEKDNFLNPSPETPEQ